MSVIIRLQGLPWSASAMNIRHFFTGLNIPAGGVHIIGGEGGDAFIAFSSDDDARMAMKKNMSPLNGTIVQLFLSSKSEMQSVIDAARSASSTVTPTVPAAVPQNMPQPAQKQQQFSNMQNMYPMDNQNQNQNNMSGAMTGPGQMGDFNQPMQNQFVKNDWQNFQMYGGGGYGGDDQQNQNQQMPNQFQANQRFSGNQMEARFPAGNDRGQYPVQQQDNVFPVGNSQFNNSGNQMQPQVSANVGTAGINPGSEVSSVGSVNQKQALYGDNAGVRPGNLPAGEAAGAMMTNIPAMGRGQMPFPGQVNMDPNRNTFTANMGPAAQSKDVSANIPGNLLGGNFSGNLGGNFPANMPGNFSGNMPGNFPANMPGNVSGNMPGNFYGNMAGNISGNLPGNLPGSLSGNISATLPGNASRNLPGNLSGNLSGNVSGNLARNLTGNLPGNFSGNLPGIRGSGSDGILGRRNSLEDNNILGGTTGDTGRVDKFSNQFSSHLGQADSDELKDDMMDWGDDNSPDIRVMGSQKPYNQSTQEDKIHINREKMPEMTPFQQFPYRGDPDRVRVNRVLEAVERSEFLKAHEERNLMERHDREPSFPGRDFRMGNRFAATQEQEERFQDKPASRFSKEHIPPEESMPSTKYPPDIDQEEELEDNRPPGRFAPQRGRNDEMRYPTDERAFPPDQRFPNDNRRLPNRDQAFPPDQDRFPEGDVKFSQAGRGYLPDERRHLADNRRFPGGQESNRFSLEDNRFPPEDRAGVPPGRIRSEDFSGSRRPGDDPFAAEDSHFRERGIAQEELGQRDGFGRGRRGFEDRFTHDRPGEGRPNVPTDLRDFDEGEEFQHFPPDRRFPPERTKWNEGEELRGPPVDERRGGPQRWDRDRFTDWQEDSDRFRPAGVPRDNTDYSRLGQQDDMDLEEPVDMDQRAGHDLMAMRVPPDRRGPPEGRRAPPFEVRGGPGIEGVRTPSDLDGMRALGMDDRRGGPGDERRGPRMEAFRAPQGEGRGYPMEGMRGRGIDGTRGRGGFGLDGRRGPGVPSMADENSFDYGHGSVGRGRPISQEEGGEFEESADFDNRFQGPGEKGGIFDRSQRGRGDAFFNRGRPGLPLGRGRGLDVDRGFEEAGPDNRFNMDVDARNVGGRPDGPPIRTMMGDIKQPDFTVKPGSGKGLLGDAPPMDRPAPPKPEIEKNEVPNEPIRRDLENKSARRSNERDRDRRSADRDRRGRDREDRRSIERDRSRYRWERDRSDRRRSRSRDRSRDRDGRRSRDRDRSSSKKDHDSLKSDSHSKSEPRKKSIHMKNVPTNATFRDIRRFLEPIEIPYDGMKIISDKQGQKTGDVFVQFRHTDDAGRAARRNGERLSGRIISITLCTDDEFSTASESLSQTKKDNAPPTDSQKSEKDATARYIVQVKNLPMNITKQDIVQFFKGLTIDNNGEAIYIDYDQSGIATGIAIVEFKNDYDYKKALIQDGNLLGAIVLRVFPGKKEEADELKKNQQEMLQRAALRNMGGSLMMQQPLLGQPPRFQGQPPRFQGQPPRFQGQPPRIQGLPPRGQGQPLGPPGQQPGPHGQPTGPPNQPTGPHGQTPGPHGQPPGPHGQPPRPGAPTPRPALIGPRPMLGPRPGLSQSPSPSTQPAPANQNTKAPTPAENNETVCVHIQGLPLLATPQDIREFFTDCQIAQRGINIAHDSRGKPLGEGFVEFKFKSDFEKAIKKDKTSLGRHIVAVKPIGKKEMIERLDNARGLPVQQVTQQNQQNQEEQNKSQGAPQNTDKQQNSSPQVQPNPSLNQGQKTPTPGGSATNSNPTQGPNTTPTSGSKSIPAGVLNKNWYYVRCQNFPTDVTIAEIHNFFQGFRPIGESIRLHYSNEGKPTGNAVVGFLSQDEAQRTLQRLNMKPCRQNIVTLHSA